MHARTAGETQLERGKYLMESIAACGNCHTPRGPNGPLLDRAFSGGPPIKEDLFIAQPCNIRPDPETGIGKWTDQQINAAIREGRRPDGTLIGSPMPFEQYRGMADADLDALVAYLRSVQTFLVTFSQRPVEPEAIARPADLKKLGEIVLKHLIAAGSWLCVLKIRFGVDAANGGRKIATR